MIERNKTERTIKTQQRIIDDLEEEVKKLKEENDDLKVQLELEKNIPKEGYERAKELMIGFEEKQAELQHVINEYRDLKAQYDVLYKKKLQEIESMKKELREKLQNVVKTTKKEMKFIRRANKGTNGE